MRITILGSAAAEGWPGVFCACEFCKEARKRGGRDLRMRTSYLIDNDIMVDCGPDIYANILRFGLDLSVVDTMLITHSHFDHFVLDNFHMRETPFAHGPAMTDVYGNDTVMAAFIGDAERKRVNLHTMRSFDTVKKGDITITALRALHDRSEECLLYLLERGGKTLFISHDTGIYPEDTWAALEGRHLDAVIFDCTNGPQQEGTNHMGIPDIEQVCGRLRGMGVISKNTLLIANHFSHNCGLLHEELSKALDEKGMLTGYDGMVLEI